MEKLSIIVPVYSTEQYIHQCLDSLIKQTYKNIEIICVDDCSPDNSASIIKNMAEQDNRIKYIKHSENKSQGGARNTGINIATGKYVTFVDSDDYLQDYKCYENAINKLEKYNADISIFSYVKEYCKKQVKYPFSKGITGFHKINNNNFTKVLCTPWNKIFKLDDIKKHNLLFPEKIKFEDEAFWYKYVAAVEPVAYIENRYSYVYRIHSGSTMANNNQYIYDYLDITLDIIDYLKSINKNDYYQTSLLNLLYTPASSDEIINLSEDKRKIIADKFNKCISYVSGNSNDINERVGARVYAYFIDDKIMRENYLKEIEKLKQIKYKILKPNIFFYKLKRETNRIIMQIKNKWNK